MNESKHRLRVRAVRAGPGQDLWVVSIDDTAFCWGSADHVRNVMNTLGNDLANLTYAIDNATTYDLAITIESPDPIKE